MESQRVGHDWAAEHMSTAMLIADKRKNKQKNKDWSGGKWQHWKVVAGWCGDAVGGQSSGLLLTVGETESAAKRLPTICLWTETGLLALLFLIVALAPHRLRPTLTTFYFTRKMKPFCGFSERSSNMQILMRNLISKTVLSLPLNLILSSIKQAEKWISLLTAQCCILFF